MPNWVLKNNQLNKDFSFKNFQKAIDFVNQVAQLAEAADHHPDILIYNYNNVRLSLSSHKAGQVTDKDYELAKKIDLINFQHKKL